jgi:hypothetical protein
MEAEGSLPDCKIERYLTCVIYILEDVHMVGRNTKDFMVYTRINWFHYTCVHLLVLYIFE